MSSIFWSQCVPIAGTIVVLALLIPSAALAIDPVNKSRGGVAIKGYDPVAYFEKGEPVKGSKEFQHEWQGATWRFSSMSNRDRFAADPDKYAPKYGGYCAYAVSQGSTADIDPEAWTIVEGKLYLNYSKQVREIWAKDIPGNIKKADRHWREILNR